MNAFSVATDSLFADDNMATDALWRAGSVGLGVPVRVILSTPDRITGFGEGRFVTETVLLDVRVAQIATLAPGDSFYVGGDLFEVRGEPVRDPFGLVWRAEARRS